jgi:hypothetical protein
MRLPSLARDHFPFIINGAQPLQSEQVEDRVARQDFAASAIGATRSEPNRRPPWRTTHTTAQTRWPA